MMDKCTKTELKFMHTLQNCSTCYVAMYIHVHVKAGHVEHLPQCIYFL